MNDLVGQSLGRYHILEQLGEGGMATVYKAYDTRLERDVAIKIIRTERLSLETIPKALKRFEREAKALGKLTHPNIVPISDYGEHEGKPYLVMPFLPGGTLKQRQGKPTPWQEAVRILLPIAQALEYAHEQNLIHRDVKPSNILLTDKGQPMLSDFGVAKIFGLEETVDLTGTGMGVGTPEYMAPEQWKGESTAQSDVYALGTVFYEMVAGRKPYTADTPAELLLKQANDPLPRPKQFVSNLPNNVEKVLLKALAKEPKDRYQNMGEMVAALERLIGGTVESAPKKTRKARKPREKGRKESGLPKWIWWVGAGMVGFGILFGIFYWIGSNVPTQVVPTQTQTITAIPTLTHTPKATKKPEVTLTPEPTATPELGTGSSWTRPADGMVMMYIFGGEFSMGSEDGDSDEQPVHVVYLNAFWIDQTEVTNSQYVKCMDAGGCKDPGGSKRSNAELYPNHPVAGNWDMATTYCQWAGARLPTEAEWEKAARGGLEGKQYPWGNEDPTCKAGALNGAQSYNCPGQGLVEVKTFAPNRFKLYDMVGNVNEWVADWYDPDYYSNSPSLNPSGPINGWLRVLRGGSYNYQDRNLRLANRNGVIPTYTYLPYGFRCARDVTP